MTPLPYLRLGAAAVALAVAAGGGYWIRDQSADKREAELLKERAETVTAAVTLGQSIERDLADGFTGDVQRAKQTAETYARRAAALTDERGRMRNAIAELASRGAVDPSAGPTDRGETTAGPGLVLAFLRRGVDEAMGDAEELAAIADTYRRAGLGCEAGYDRARDRLRGWPQGVKP